MLFGSLPTKKVSFRGRLPLSLHNSLGLRTNLFRRDWDSVIPEQYATAKKKVRMRENSDKDG